eukprot:783070-Rhodomonas_salina.1
MRGRDGDVGGRPGEGLVGDGGERDRQPDLGLGGLDQDRWPAPPGAPRHRAGGEPQVFGVCSHSRAHTSHTRVRAHTLRTRVSRQVEEGGRERGRERGTVERGGRWRGVTKAARERT